MYGGVEEVEGKETFIRAWEEDYLGGERRLIEYEFLNPRIYDGCDDEALGEVVV